MLGRITNDDEMLFAISDEDDTFIDTEPELEPETEPGRGAEIGERIDELAEREVLDEELRNDPIAAAAALAEDGDDGEGAQHGLDDTCYNRGTADEAGVNGNDEEDEAMNDESKNTIERDTVIETLGFEQRFDHAVWEQLGMRLRDALAPGNDDMPEFTLALAIAECTLDSLDDDDLDNDEDVSRMIDNGELRYYADVILEGSLQGGLDNSGVDVGVAFDASVTMLAQLAGRDDYRPDDQGGGSTGEPPHDVELR